MAEISLPPSVRWGLIFGVPQAALVLVSACAGALGVGENLSSNVTLGYLFLPVLVIVTSGLIYLAGKRTARQTHRWWQGMVAGIIAAEICALSITLIAWVSGAANGAPATYYLGGLLVPALVGVLGGAILGLIGGLAAG